MLLYLSSISLGAVGRPRIPPRDPELLLSNFPGQRYISRALTVFSALLFGQFTVPVLLSARVTPRLRLYILPDGMAVALSAVLLLLLCTVGPALSSHDVDCSNETAQGAWLVANTPLTCVSALSSLRTNTEFTPANVALVKTVSVPFSPLSTDCLCVPPATVFPALHNILHTFRSLLPPSSLRQVCAEDCGNKFVEWLESEDCHDQPIAEQTALEFSRTVCASFNGLLDGNCLFSNATGRVDQNATTAILKNCAAWWLGTAQGVCPSGMCASAIQTAVDRIKCCYNNFFSTNTAVDMITR